MDARTDRDKTEYVEFMGDPCFTAIEGPMALQQVEVLDKLFVGSLETITDEAFAQRMDKAHDMGGRVVDEINEAVSE